MSIRQIALDKERRPAYRAVPETARAPKGGSMDVSQAYMDDIMLQVNGSNGTKMSLYFWINWISEYIGHQRAVKFWFDCPVLIYVGSNDYNNNIW